MSAPSVKVDPADKVYARIIEIFTLAGLVIMVIGLLLYIAKVMPAYVDLNELVKYWNKNTKAFWMSVKGFVPKTYNWIFKNLDKSDMVSVLGVLLLPVGITAGVLYSIIVYAKSKDKLLIVAIAVAIILLIAIVGPYIGLRVR